MEITTEKQIEKVLYYRNTEAENIMKSGAEAAAQALNSVYEHFKFKNISEIPSNVQEWITRRTLETNPELAKLAKVHKLETLKYEVPAWITKAGQAFSNWHSVKNSHTQFLQYCPLVDEKFIVDYEMLEQEFENSETYRKYLTNESQLKRLDYCRRFIALLKEVGITNGSTFFAVFSGRNGNPWIKIVNDKIIPSKEYVLSNTILASQPIVQDPTYYLSGWQLTQ